MDIAEVGPIARRRRGLVRDDAALEALLAHPQFPAAARRLSQNMLAIAQSNASFDAIVKDVGRFAATGIAMYLHASGGLTLPRLKDVCAHTKLISPGRARAILLFLRFLRYVEPAQGEHRPALYVPTEDLLNAWHSMTSGVMDAAQLLDPSIASISNRLADHGLLLELARLQGEIALFAQNQGPKDTAFWQVVLNRHAGMQIVQRLMLSAGDTDEFPPRGSLAFSARDLARQFRVSRVHVARLIKAGEREGMFLCVGDTLILSDRVRNELRLVAGLRLLAAQWSVAEVRA